jgi:hypothetical protein
MNVEFRKVSKPKLTGTDSVSDFLKPYFIKYFPTICQDTDFSLTRKEIL